MLKNGQLSIFNTENELNFASILITQTIANSNCFSFPFRVQVTKVLLLLLKTPQLAALPQNNSSKIGDFYSNFSHQIVLYIAMATKTIAAWSTRAVFTNNYRHTCTAKTILLYFILPKTINNTCSLG